MIAWYWLIVVALASGSFGAFIMAIIASGARRHTPQAEFEVIITDDKRAERTKVEIGEMGFAFPVGCGYKLADLLTQFTAALGGQSNYQMPEEDQSVKRTHRLTMFGKKL